MFVKKRKIQVLGLLSHKNLAREVHMYGYHYSSKTHLFLILGVLTGSIALGLIFRLLPPFILAVVISSLLILPLLILAMYERMYEQKRFSEAGQYVDQMLYSFLKHQKIYASLKDCMRVMKEGGMYEVMEQAVFHIDRGVADTDAGVLREALSGIAAAYPAEKIQTANELMLRVEERGGEFEHSVNLLLQDADVWKRSCYRLQAEKKQRHVETVLCIIFSTFLCGAVLYALNWAGALFPSNGTFDIFSYPIVQLTSTILIIFHLFVFYKSSKNLTADWLSERQVCDEKLVLSGYETVMHYDPDRERKKSILFSAPFFTAAAAGMILEKNLPAVVCLGLAVFLLFQHRIGYKLAKDTVRRELYVRFPQWLMDLALLMQSNNVYVSLRKSRENAAELFASQLDELLRRIEEKPDDVESYTAFFGEFEIPEITSCMQMLYAVAENGNGDVDAQVEHLIRRIHEMQEQIQEASGEHAKFKMDMVFSYPMAAACAKMAVDMTFGMVVMLAMLGSMQLGG